MANLKKQTSKGLKKLTPDEILFISNIINEGITE